MGSDHSGIAESEFSKNWRVLDTVDSLTVWENRQNPAQQLEQYFVQDAEDDNARRISLLRRTSPSLVGAFELHQDSSGCCTDRHGTKLFVERIPLRLSNLEDIPFPDVLHLLDACLTGFAELSAVVGFFRVDEDQVGVSERGQVKVWLSTAFESSTLVGNRSVPQQEMLQDILALVFQAEDAESFPPNVPPLAQAITLPDRAATFDSVRQQFRDYVGKYTQSFVPSSLQCVHAAGGALLINDWCRTNRSYGFEQNSLRLSERALQSKIARSQTAPVAVPAPVAVLREEQGSSAHLIDSQLARAFEERAGQQPLLSITSGVQQQEQLRQDLPQLHHRVIQQPQASQVLPQRIVNITPQQALPPPQIIHQSFQQQQASQVLPQRIPQQVFIPQQQIIAPQQQLQQPQIFLPPQQQPIAAQQPQVTVRPQAVSPAPQPFFVNAASSNVMPVGGVSAQPSIQFLEKQASRKEIISEVLPQTDSRLQQQRVISQTIEIKDNSRATNANAQQTATTPSYSYDPQRSSEDVQQRAQPADDLHSYARAVPFSVNVAEERFAPTEDGKSSAEFLALLSQLKGGASSNYEVYSQAADTPSYTKANPSEGSPKQYFSYLPQESYAESPGQQEFKPSRYEGGIDPELQADLARYQRA